MTLPSSRAASDRDFVALLFLAAIPYPPATTKHVSGHMEAVSWLKR
jgi:hypothetical protein